MMVVGRAWPARISRASARTSYLYLYQYLELRQSRGIPRPSPSNVRVQTPRMPPSLHTRSTLRCLPRFLFFKSHASRPTHRSLHLAPPWLLDDYIPRFHLISSVDAAKKRSEAYAHLRECNLCPRLCGVNRYEKTGVCLIGAETVKVNTIAPHFGEEPCFQGHHGSGSVFFSGCNLRCGKYWPGTNTEQFISH